MSEWANKAMIAPSEARGEGIGAKPLKFAIVTQRVRLPRQASPVRPKASHQAGSRPEVRSPRGGVRSRRKASAQAALLNPEICRVAGTRIGVLRDAESRRIHAIGRQQTGHRFGEVYGSRRDLRTGHAHTGVIRELGRASCLLQTGAGRRGQSG